MNDFEYGNYDHSELYDEFWVMASFFEREDGVHEEQIGEVTLRKDLVQNDMPFELEINGTTYKRED